ncbi:hypothetical protein SO802_022598 [Lithocarpus litseifolius]|uniref:LAGLIDADG homing endonuclease n=1 Tax=Lithocarpus litseifolius TaxID=425828 RepID=A0AAW2C9F9_9ROSI
MRAVLDCGMIAIPNWSYRVSGKVGALFTEEGGCYFLLRIVERGKYFMRSIFMGKNASQWLMNHIKHMVVGASSKQFFTFREGDIAFTLQRSSNSFGQFLHLTELKVGGARRSVIIPEGKGKNGWRVFGLELRKLLNPSQYAMGGTGHPKFIPQVLWQNLETQHARTFADVVQGFQGRVEDGKQLSITVKEKRTQSGEAMMGVNQRPTGAKVGLAPAGKRGQCINEEAEVGEQNLAYCNMRFPSLSLNAKALEKGKKKSVVRNPCWSGRGLIVEVDVRGRRRVSWDRKKRGVQELVWASQAVERDRIKVGPKVCKWVAREIKQAEVKPVMGPCTSPRSTDTLVGPPISVFSSPSLFEVGETSLAGTGSLVHTPATVASLLAPSQAFALEPKVSGRCAKPSMETNRAGLVELGVIGGSEDDWARCGCLKMVRYHSSEMVSTAKPVDRLAKPTAVAGCTISDGFSAEETLWNPEGVHEESASQFEFVGCLVESVLKKVCIGMGPKQPKAHYVFNLSPMATSPGNFSGPSTSTPRNDLVGSFLVSLSQVVSQGGAFRTDTDGDLVSHPWNASPVGVSGYTDHRQDMVFWFSSDRKSFVGSNMVSGGLVCNYEADYSRICAEIDWTICSRALFEDFAVWVRGFWSFGSGGKLLF